MGEMWREWHRPLSMGRRPLGEGMDELAALGAEQDEIPFIVQLMENPRWEIPGLDLAPGAVDLHHHDAVHVLLGRGLLQKDEAFVIGFTMGSTRKIDRISESLFTFVARHLYPGIFRFDDEDAAVFGDAVRLAWICGAPPLNKVDFDALRAVPTAELRNLLSVDEDMLRSYYALEARRLPHAPESRRLLS